MKKRFFIKCLGVAALAAALALVPRMALAHAVLVKSAPAANATVAGPELPITLTFNSRVDSAHSTIAIVDAAGKSTTLTLEEQTAPNTLSAHAGQLAPGRYAIHWQALAIDGHATRGVVPFVVK